MRFNPGQLAARCDCGLPVLPAVSIVERSSSKEFIETKNTISDMKNSAPAPANTTFPKKR